LSNTAKGQKLSKYGKVGRKWGKLGVVWTSWAKSWGAQLGGEARAVSWAYSTVLLF